MKLPNASQAFVDIDKLSEYCLSPYHKRGKHKAHLFFSVLGLTENDAYRLRKTLLEAVLNYDAEEGCEDMYGKRYTVDFIMATAKGKATVRSAWIIRTHEKFARLTSCYILKQGRESYE